MFLLSRHHLYVYISRLSWGQDNTNIIFSLAIQKKNIPYFFWNPLSSKHSTHNLWRRKEKKSWCFFTHQSKPPMKYLFIRLLSSDRDQTVSRFGSLLGEFAEAFGTGRIWKRSLGTQKILWVFVGPVSKLEKEQKKHGEMGKNWRDDDSAKKNGNSMCWTDPGKGSVKHIQIQLTCLPDKMETLRDTTGFFDKNVYLVVPETSTWKTGWFQLWWLQILRCFKKTEVISPFPSIKKAGGLGFQVYICTPKIALFFWFDGWPQNSCIMIFLKHPKLGSNQSSRPKLKVQKRYTPEN